MCVQYAPHPRMQHGNLLPVSVRLPSRPHPLNLPTLPISLPGKRQNSPTRRSTRGIRKMVSDMDDHSKMKGEIRDIVKWALVRPRALRA